MDLGDSGAGGCGNSRDSGDTRDLESTDPTTITGPRNPDGSIPSSDFLVPANSECAGGAAHGWTPSAVSRRAPGAVSESTSPTAAASSAAVSAPASATPTP